MKEQRLMWVWYPTTSASGFAPPGGGPGYVVASSLPFPAETSTRRIVAVNWSEPGEVGVTWLIDQ
jgi:hypothetical protein